MAKIIHRGHLINPRGGVSALCFSRPRAIDLRSASWTNRDEAVTCPKCIDVRAENGIAVLWLARGLRWLAGDRQEVDRG